MEGLLAVQNESVRPHLIQTHSPPYKSSYADVTLQGKNPFKSDVISQGKKPLNQDLMSEIIKQLANMNNTVTTLMNIRTRSNYDCVQYDLFSLHGLFFVPY